jgi:hypothetical protein
MGVGQDLQAGSVRQILAGNDHIEVVGLHQVDTTQRRCGAGYLHVVREGAGNCCQQLGLSTCKKYPHNSGCLGTCKSPRACSGVHGASRIGAARSVRFRMVRERLDPSRMRPHSRSHASLTLTYYDTRSCNGDNRRTPRWSGAARRSATEYSDPDQIAVPAECDTV